MRALIARLLDTVAPLTEPEVSGWDLLDGVSQVGTPTPPPPNTPREA